ncbi:NADPH-dependent FMN reductase [Beutenbergia cavernae DSM 12333]|uniref:NADPH-dependent FMN reductase n=1 Tax=Beutenbergia cavernae (strain ATCC BAA-8 / DSM 12333 / CCUG 43141 / JCM 11478 / NBRC 16432 / NCIMB 13614 / HKI 0122) TaxID=471853 RepID=C5BX15_BEUC1|nr:NAD(P)H-dependent oxidoreductase [Beutenbergia cavernae]ACQ78690.1 NADPH-dependent FMN reductase [Beutenbergia cavernae DSM 12333]
MTLLTAVVGNPRQGSRTHALTATVVDQLARAVDADEIETVDLAALGAALIDPAGEGPRAARELAAASDLLVVATPVYKATYTGLLKLFLDGYGSNGLDGVTAVGVVVSAAPGHLLSTDIHLRSLLVELGAVVPTRSLGVVEAQLEGAASLVAEWTSAHADTLRRLTGPASGARQVAELATGGRA